MSETPSPIFRLPGPVHYRRYSVRPTDWQANGEWIPQFPLAGRDHAPAQEGCQGMGPESRLSARLHTSTTSHAPRATVSSATRTGSPYRPVPVTAGRPVPAWPGPARPGPSRQDPPPYGGVGSLPLLGAPWRRFAPTPAVGRGVLWAPGLSSARQFPVLRGRCLRMAMLRVVSCAAMQRATCAAMPRARPPARRPGPPDARRGKPQMTLSARRG
jgi:hypothetical protein